MKILSTLSGAWRGIQTDRRSGPSGFRTRREVVVRPAPRLAWVDKGFERIIDGASSRYRGHFKVLDPNYRRWQTYQAEIIERDGIITAFIADPPAALKHHPKAACFTREDGPWFRVHWFKPPANIDDCVLYVERVVFESLRDFGRQP